MRIEAATTISLRTSKQQGRVSIRMKGATTILLVLCGILSFCTLSFSQPQEEKMRVAVVEFDEKGDVGIKDVGSIVAELMVTSLGKIGRWEMVERVLLRDVLEEQGLGLTGVIDQETAAEIGKVYGVKRLIVGSVIKLGTSITVTARLINTDNAQILKTAEVETSKIEELRQKVAELASLLTRAYGTLVISSIPLEAEVYLDGEYVARTPVRLQEVEEGEHRLLLRKEGYTEKTELTTAREGEITQVEVSLSKLLGGNIQVESTPPEARVYLDEMYKGETPLALTGLPPGPYKVMLEKEGREDYEEEVIVERGKTTTVKAALVQLFATLRVTSNPKGASIYVNERYFGITPKELTDLRPGSHTVKLTKPGYEEYITKILLIEGQEILIDVKLERQYIEEKKERTLMPKLKSPLAAGVIGLFTSVLPGGHWYAGDTSTAWWLLGGVVLGSLIQNSGFERWNEGQQDLGLAIMVAVCLYDIIHAPTAARNYNKRVTREYEQNLSSNFGLYMKDNKIYLGFKGRF